MRANTMTRVKKKARKVAGQYVGLVDAITKFGISEHQLLARRVRLMRKNECRKQRQTCSRCYCEACDDILDLIREMGR